MIHIDTSSFLKLFLVETESSDVESVVARISCVVVSQLAFLEATVQVRGMIEGGSLTRKVGKYVMRDMPDLIQNQPFVFHNLAGTVFDTALTQQSSAKAIAANTRAESASGQLDKRLGTIHDQTLTTVGVMRWIGMRRPRASSPQAPRTETSFALTFPPPANTTHPPPASSHQPTHPAPAPLKPPEA